MQLSGFLNKSGKHCADEGESYDKNVWVWTEKDSEDFSYSQNERTKAINDHDLRLHSHRS
jgi:hypothetical protein